MILKTGSWQNIDTSCNKNRWIYDQNIPNDLENLTLFGENRWLSGFNRLVVARAHNKILIAVIIQVVKIRRCGVACLSRPLSYRCTKHDKTTISGFKPRLSHKCLNTTLCTYLPNYFSPWNMFCLKTLRNYPKTENLS